MTEVSGSVYFIRDELRAEFLAEVKTARNHVKEIHPNIFYSESVVRHFWVLDFWKVDSLSFKSISDAATRLRRLRKNWVYVGGVNFRRGQLIAEALRIKSEKPLLFSSAEKNPSAAAFTLQDKNIILWSSCPLKGHFAGGQIRFVEDKTGPPSRAYLKLWEAFTLMGFYPGKEDMVLDLGATPGGWSYVVASLGARVVMVDRSEPDEGLFKKFPNIKFQRGDGLNPSQELVESATVILSDMACEPAKLLLAVEKWLALRKLRAMVCTLKFHGLSDLKIIQQFAEISGSELFHLWHNGHELTWIWRRPVIE